jgi:pimeloyl-ACP methyl ester carboxylesterase
MITPKKTSKNRAGCGVTRMLSRRAFTRAGCETHHYYVGGSGKETLAIVNAFGRSLAFWDLLVESLMKRYRVVIWQPRGALAQDGAMECAYSIEEHARDMRAILDAEAIERAHLVGWCSAPKIVLAFHAANRQRVASMMFLSGSFAHHPEFRRFHSNYEDSMAKLCRIVDRRPALAAQVIEMLRDLLAAQVAGADADADGVERKEDNERAHISNIKSLVFEPYRTVSSVVGYARQFLLSSEYDIRHLLPQIDVPTLIVNGDDDHIVTSRMGRAIAARISGAVHVQVHDGSHYLQCDNHQLTAMLATNFFEKGFAFDFDSSLVECTRNAAAELEHAMMQLWREAFEDRAYSLAERPGLPRAAAN